MIYLYLFALVLGFVLLGASILLGGHSEGAAQDTETGTPGEATADGHDAPGGFESFFFAFLSMRFWTFFLAFFGLTGVVLDGLGLVSSSAVAAVLATLMGLLVGSGAYYVMKRLRADDSNSAARADDYVGKSARVLVAFGPGEVGKVRVEVRGNTVDLLAVPIEEGSRFAAKDEVMVVEMDGTRARVARTTDRLSTN